jgi:hypothetical protein
VAVAFDFSSRQQKSPTLQVKGHAKNPFQCNIAPLVAPSMIPSLETLIKLEPPPAKPIAPGRPDGWREVENRLHLRLPNDYKSLTSIYGVGHWLDFVEIMNPFQPWQHASSPDFFDWAGKRLAGLDERHKFRPGFSAPFLTHPSSNGLLPFAYDDDGGTLCWQVSGQPDSWPIICLDNKMSGRFDRFDMSLTGFLVALLKDEIFPRTFKENIFPIRHPAFQPGARD